MSEDQLNARLDKQDRILEEIRTALVGNPSMGNPGLVKRVEAVEDTVSKERMERIKWAGFAAGVAFIATALKEKMFH